MGQQRGGQQSRVDAMATQVSGDETAQRSDSTESVPTALLVAVYGVGQGEENPDYLFCFLFVCLTTGRRDKF